MALVGVAAIVGPSGVAGWIGGRAAAAAPARTELLAVSFESRSGLEGGPAAVIWEHRCQCWTYVRQARRL